jgi:GNAT superfamily N-acetyltransferase
MKTFNMIYIVTEDPGTEDAAFLLSELSAALQAITGSSGTASFDASDVRVENARFVVARDANGQPVGCGAFRPLATGVAEIKRMYARVPGAGSAVLAFLEREAQQLGFAALRLETRTINEKAVAFYERHGYVKIPNYGKYAGKTEAVCFEKPLRGQFRHSDTHSALT